MLLLPGHPASDAGVIASCVERGFELLRPDGWNFPPVAKYQIVLDKEFDDFAVIDDFSDELFAYPVTAIPRDWFGHVSRERSCLVITGVDLALATRGIAGVHEASERGQAVAGMMLLNDGSVIDAPLAR